MKIKMTSLHDGHKGHWYVMVRVVETRFEKFLSARFSARGKANDDGRLLLAYLHAFAPLPLTLKTTPGRKRPGVVQHLTNTAINS
ncbi:hypothetical protein [Pseudomonas sp. FW300-N2A2]|uniref:hypothetical protein n=1 Tax=Pseudomonas sp. FW300-N2A2 TaxID=2751316 RepID=UPI001A917E49|nr:hypothetical protein [Pseudomonas sp. FW300-N2A2]